MLEGGNHEFPHHLGARRLIEHELALVAHVVVSRIEQNQADLFGQACRTRVPQVDDLASCTLDRINEKFRLRGLAASVNAFERNEQTLAIHSVPSYSPVGGHNHHRNRMPEIRS